MSAADPFSPLALFDRFTPKDAGAGRVARDLAYGAHPRQRLDLYAPREARNLPLLAYFYGGSWDSGCKNYYRWLGRALAARGFLVAISDYRLAPEAHFPDFLEDAAAALACAAGLAREHGGDPDRVLLSGHSAGAYSAIMLALDRRWLEAVGVEARRVRAAAGLAGPYDFYPFDVPASINAFGRAPEPLQTQPIAFVRSDAPPLWLASGERDDLVRPRNSLVLAERLKAAGGRAEARIFPTVRHVSIMLSLSVPLRGRAPVLAEMTEFLARAAG
jgi:acetyl esterase/lipase